MIAAWQSENIVEFTTGRNRTNADIQVKVRFACIFLLHPLQRANAVPLRTETAKTKKYRRITRRKTTQKDDSEKLLKCLNLCGLGRGRPGQQLI